MYSLNDPVIHVFSNRKGRVVANSNDNPNVVVEFRDGSSEVVHSAELRPSDHLINPTPLEVSERINLLIEDTTTRAIASKEFGLEGNEWLMGIDFLPLTYEMEITSMVGTKPSLKKVPLKVAKKALTNIEDRVS